jgi:oligopeptide transport system substrate-binding protein
MESPLARAAWFLSLCIFLSGCGNDPNPKPLGEKRPDGSPWQVYYYYMSDEAKSLDPQNAYDQECQIVLEPVQDCLLQYAAMKTDPYEVEPCLLESMPEITHNADGTVDYLCKFKKGVFYQDDPCFPGGKGREVVAADEEFSFQRMCDPKVECPVSAALSEYVAGMNEAMDAVKKNAGVFDYDKMKVSGIELIDAHTFKIHLLKAYPQIQFWMAMLFTAPVAREAVEYYDGQAHPDGLRGEMAARPSFKFHPVGDGPFRIAEHVQEQRYRLVRNPNYHTTVFPSGGWPAESDAVDRPLAGHALPLVDELQVTIFRDLLPMWLLTRQGYLDQMGVMHDAFNSLVSANKELTPEYTARGMKLVKVQDISTFYFVFNMQDPVLGPNKKLRQALSCAYDPTKEIEILYGGVAPAAQQLLSPGIYGFQNDFKNPYGHDLEKAKRLIAEAGYPDGIDPKTGRPLELTLDCVAKSSDDRLIAEDQKRQFEQLGIHMTIIENTFPREQEKLDDGNFQIDSGSGWGADYPDPEDYFFLFTTSNFPPEGKNSCRYSNHEFDRLFQQMAAMDDSTERMSIVKRMNAILAEDCAIIPTFNKAYYALVQPWATRTQNNFFLQVGLKYAYVDPVMREQKRAEWNRPARWPIPVAAALALAGIVYGVRLNRRRNV